MPLSWQTYDRILWLGLGIFMFAAVKGISYSLQEVERLTEIHKAQPPSPIDHHTISPDAASKREAADSIPLHSLQTLAKSTSQDLAQSAQCLILDRFMRNKACVENLCRALISTSPEERQDAKRVESFIEEHLGLTSIYEPYPASPHRFLKQGLWPGASVPPGNWDTIDDREAELWYEMPPTGRRRELEESVEEMALRRRRREAMVFNEGDHPVSQEDIIVRQQSTENAQLAPLEVSSVESPNSASATESDSTSPETSSSGEESMDEEPSVRLRQSVWGPTRPRS